jgi:hypothetical protein
MSNSDVGSFDAPVDTPVDAPNDNPQPAAESASREELAALFKEAVGADSGAKENPESELPEVEAPAKASKEEAHQPKEDPKDREIADLRSRLDGLMPRYQALQKAHEQRLAEEKQGKAVESDKSAEALKEYGEIGDIVLSLKKEIAALQQRTSVIPEVHAEVEAAKHEKAKAAQAAEEAKTAERLSELGHKDFKEISRSDEFKAWVQTLPAEDREELVNTTSPRVYAAFLADFKASRKPGPSRTTADIRAEREKRLALATAVDSTPSAASTGSTEREAIWKRAFNS